MKKLLMVGVVFAMMSGCSLFRKNADNTGKNEMTATGQSEQLDNSEMNLKATGSDTGKIDGLVSVHFDYDKSTLTASEKAKLMKNVEWLKKNASAKLTIEGHCDQRGSVEYNLALGERRAKTVKSMLVSSGVAAARLTTVSFGKEKLLDDQDTEEAMAKNRRANFVPGN